MKYILLVADQPEMAKLTTRIMERNGYEVETITEPDARVITKPELIIFDCNLQPRTGLSKFHKIVGDYPTAKILWVSSKEEEEVEALEAGADDWIRKPFPMESLMARMRNLCKRSF